MPDLSAENLKLHLIVHEVNLKVQLQKKLWHCGKYK